MKWPTLYLNGEPTRNPLDWLGALVGLVATVGPLILIVGFVVIAPVALLIKYVS